MLEEIPTLALCFSRGVEGGSSTLGGGGKVLSTSIVSVVPVLGFLLFDFLEEGWELSDSFSLLKKSRPVAALFPCFLAEGLGVTGLFVPWPVELFLGGIGILFIRLFYYFYLTNKLFSLIFCLKFFGQRIGGESWAEKVFSRVKVIW